MKTMKTKRVVKKAVAIDPKTCSLIECGRLIRPNDNIYYIATIEGRRFHEREVGEDGDYCSRGCALAARDSHKYVAW